MPVAERSSRPGRDHGGVARVAARPRRRGEDDERHRAQRRLHGVRDLELLGHRRPDALAEVGQFARLLRDDRVAERLGVDERAERAAVGEVDQDLAEPRHRHRRVERRGERRHVLERHALAAAVAAVGGHAHEAGRRLEHERRDRLGHRHDAGLEDHGRGVDRVRARHALVGAGLHDQEARVGLRVRGGQDEVERQRRRPARLEQQQPPQLVALGLEPLHLLEHRRARYVEHAADHDPARLALGVGVDAVEDPHARTLAAGGKNGRSSVGAETPACFRQRERYQPPNMQRGLLTGTGWAGTAGVVALLVLMFLFALVAFSGVRRDDGVVKLPSVREGRVVIPPPPPGRDASSATPARRGGGR